VAEREASGDFDYLLGDLTEAPPESDVPTGDNPPAERVSRVEYDAVPQAHDSGAFDAFDADTWYFEPAQPPWYRRSRALAVMIAVGAAAAALVISAALLIVRSPGGAEDTTTPVESTTTTAVSTEPTTSSEPPPAPIETSAEPIAPRPAETMQPQSPEPRSTRPPEIGVTRTPVTRSPISVAPQPRTGLR
jgi:hypothetical protein